MANERFKSIKEIFPKATEEELKRAGYESEKLAPEEQEKQLQETITLHEHLKKLEEKGEIEEFKSEEIHKGVEILPKSPEQKKEYEKCLTSAKNILNVFELDPKKEDLLIITDAKVMRVNPQMVEAVYEVAQEKTKGNFRIMVAPESKKSATPLLETIGDRMAGRPVLIMTARSRTHSPETSRALYIEEEISKRVQEKWKDLIQSEKLKKTVEKGWSVISLERLHILRDEGLEALDLNKYREFSKKRRARVISITKGHNPEEILTAGAALENIETLREKGNRVKELMKNIEKIHIISEEGTDLWLYPKVEYEDFEDGRVNKPGKVSNFPIGEWACAVKLEGTNGTLVIDGPCGGGLDRHLIGVGIKLQIEDGFVKKIEGVRHQEGREILEKLTQKDKKATELLKILDSHNLDKIFETITKEDLSEIWKELNPEKQNALKSYLAAERLKNYLELGNRDYKKKHPEDKKADAFKLAELGIGTNTKAKSPYNTKSSNGEKEYGTIHIACGRNATFGVPETDLDYNGIEIHCDMIVDHPTVECTKKNKEKFNLIEKGKTVGY